MSLISQEFQLKSSPRYEILLYTGKSGEWKSYGIKPMGTPLIGDITIFNSYPSFNYYRTIKHKSVANFVYIFDYMNVICCIVCLSYKSLQVAHLFKMFCIDLSQKDGCSFSVVQKRKAI
ncbi:hypothetical protein XELAEV_18037503mg [Xenopus laevis]|uniref:Uncharacterized protein n=1 Tax=Xenopus laevis TaxID=8355 RepID=A0A974HA94_XENLA|nr:hypothetical protein XELAEV_18037503mg [Xenopus laevis]